MLESTVSDDVEVPVRAETFVDAPSLDYAPESDSVLISETLE